MNHVTIEGITNGDITSTYVGERHIVTFNVTVTVWVKRIGKHVASIVSIPVEAHDIEMHMPLTGDRVRVTGHLGVS